MKKFCEYSNNLIDVITIEGEINKAKSFDITSYKNIDKDTMLNKNTNEIINKNHSNNKLDCKSLQKSMNSYFKTLLYNIAPILETGEVLFLTLTTDRNMSYQQFDNVLERYIDKLKYKNANFKYAFFKEANSDGRYHVHSLIWVDEGKVPFTRDYLFNKWTYCINECKNLQKINSAQDLLCVLLYLTNYSSKDPNNNKVIRKREGLIHFPPNVHLVKLCKKLQKPRYKELDDFNFNEYSIISTSERMLPDERIFKSTFFEKNF